MSLVTIARRRKASSKLLHIDTSRLFDNAEYDKHRRAERIAIIAAALAVAVLMIWPAAIAFATI
ncbi:MAG TPA: hypothetical protein PLI17_04665 [Denitromonas sp.]|uniref:hypothetical protein n=1 Tax=Denitromonas sp. TaxID=2734609 RepID=UPI002C76278C|nr:hypothetical protein [Denitromonas sp.]